MPHVKYVYALIASEENYFAEMAAVSAATLRAVMPDAHIVILSDEKTAALETPAAAKLRELSSEWVVEPLDPSFGAVERSRHLTLSMRQIIDGHIVKLDVDTLIARDLSGITDHEHDLAAVRDGNGWSRTDLRMNGGIWSARDTEQARGFFKAAYAQWREAAANGSYLEQPALNKVLASNEYPITWLPPKYNFYVFYMGQVIFNPCIYHVFSWDFNAREDTVLHVLTKELKRTGELNEKELAAFVATKNPWRKPFHPYLSKPLGRPYMAVRRKLRELRQKSS